MKNVQEFDPFYSEFRKIIFDIRKNMDDTDTLLLNISSGTPAMKSALLVLKTLGEFPCKAVQVSTPDAAMNNHDGHDAHKQHEIELLWELDEDNADDFINRCSVVKCPTLSQIQQESYIRKLLDEYDYAASYEIAQMLPAEITANYIGLLQMASRRVLLDLPGVDQVLRNDDRFTLPVQNSAERRIFEYALNLKLKLLRHEYADFIRGVTPLFFDLYERILSRHAKINLSDYCRTHNGKILWDEQKLQGTDVLRTLTFAYSSFHYDVVNSAHLNELIQESSAPSDVKKLVQDLRSVESNLRNMTAHQIISVTEESIKKSTGFSGTKIMDHIYDAFVSAGFNIKKEFWNSYDDMNEVIIAAMSQNR
jgi:CRISPR type III-A/MTUBE-associated protein Csm6